MSSLEQDQVLPNGTVAANDFVVSNADDTMTSATGRTPAPPEWLLSLSRKYSITIPPTIVTAFHQHAVDEQSFLSLNETRLRQDLNLPLGHAMTILKIISLENEGNNDEASVTTGRDSAPSAPGRKERLNEFLSAEEKRTHRSDVAPLHELDTYDLSTVEDRQRLYLDRLGIELSEKTTTILVENEIFDMGALVSLSKEDLVNMKIPMGAVAKLVAIIEEWERVQQRSVVVPRGRWRNSDEDVNTTTTNETY